MWSASHGLEETTQVEGLENQKQMQHRDMISVNYNTCLTTIKIPEI
jgi:hypothetical protein